MRTSAISERDLRYRQASVQRDSPTEFPIYLTLKEVADLLKVKPRTVYAWVSDRRIPFERKGGLLRFRLDAVIAWDEPER
jgi:excisionase family DNA binding protein